MAKKTTKKTSKPQPIIAIRLQEDDYEIISGLAEYNDCEKTPLIKNCTYEQIDKIMDVQRWVDACNKCEEEGKDYSKTEMLL